MKPLQQNLGYFFNNVDLLRTALTHKSYDRDKHNERLEFIGDGILDCVISLCLYNMYPQLTEGDLSQIRSTLVNRNTLAVLANELNLGQYLQLADSEIKTGGRARPSLLADAFEAVIAAIFLDSDFATITAIISKLYEQKLRQVKGGNLNKDNKSQLQEYLQALGVATPTYHVIEATGPEHDSTFTIKCLVKELGLEAVARGKTKKDASQSAAARVIALMQKKYKLQQA